MCACNVSIHRCAVVIKVSSCEGAVDAILDCRAKLPFNCCALRCLGVTFDHVFECRTLIIVNVLFVQSNCSVNIHVIAGMTLLPNYFLCNLRGDWVM